MKKRISGILALSMAMALTIGMTVGAAESPSTGESEAPVISEVIEADTTVPEDSTVVADLEKKSGALNSAVGTITSDTKILVEGKEVPVTVEAPKPVTAGVMNSANKTAATIVAKLVEQNKIAVAENKEAVATPIAATDVEIKLPAGITEIPATGISLTIQVPNLKVDANKTYFLMHLRSDGVWETLPATVVDGAVTATFTSFSPIVVVEVTQQEKVQDDTDDSDDSDDSDNTVETTTVQSPKTGEAVPFAAVFAIVCVAGAAYSVKRIKYNK